jgi:chromosomal replication initiator protein
MGSQTAQDIWTTALGQLQLQVSKLNYKTWLERTKALSFQDDNLVVSAPNSFVSEYLDKNLRSLIEKTLIGIVQKEIKISFNIESQNCVPEVETETAITVSSAPDLPHLPSLTRLGFNPKYTFESFVVSDCNQLAHAVASNVAEKPGLCSYNPLYIYGGVGLGKTHLLNAIGNAVLTRGLRVIYVSAEQFTNEFINSIRERKTDDFRQKYRNTDMLLIDDIQFISGKEHTEESFFHIFNELRDTDRQIALTSNCSPNSIPLIEERLRSRLEWGLSAEIKPPDLNTRMAILSQKAQKDSLSIDPTILAYIAEHIQQNIRELEASLNRLKAYANLLHMAITPELAREALRDVIDTNHNHVKPVSIDLLLEAVAGHFGMTVENLRGGKSRQHATARQIASYLLKEQTDFTLSFIAQKVGIKEPISVSNAHKKIAGNLQNPDLKRTIAEIMEKTNQKARLV